jgi:hypothetical protein
MAALQMSSSDAKCLYKIAMGDTRIITRVPFSHTNGTQSLPSKNYKPLAFQSHDIMMNIQLSMFALYTGEQTS